MFLTNSLSGWFEQDDATMRLPWPEAAAEIEAANKYKLDKKVLVVLGNPPYEGYSNSPTTRSVSLNRGSGRCGPTGGCASIA